MIVIINGAGMTERQNGLENRLAKNWLNFIEKLYFTNID